MCYMYTHTRRITKAVKYHLNDEKLVQFPWGIYENRVSQLFNDTHTPTIIYNMQYTYTNLMFIIHKTSLPISPSCQNSYSHSLVRH